MPRVVLVRGDAEVASWAIPAGQNLDLSMVDHLARLQLAARRAGCSLRLRDAPSRLRELLNLAGLSDIVTDAAKSASTDPAGPASTDPAGPASTDPAAPASTDPAAPASTDPAGPASTDPAGPASTDPAGPASTDPAGPASTDPAAPAGEPGDGGTAARGPG